MDGPNPVRPLFDKMKYRRDSSVMIRCDRHGHRLSLGLCESPSAGSHTGQLHSRLTGGRFYGEYNIRRKLPQPASLTCLRGLTGFGSAPVVTRRLMQPPGTSRVSCL